MTRQIVYLIKPHPRLKNTHELHVQYENGKKKIFVGTQLKKSIQEVDQLLKQKETTHE